MAFHTLLSFSNQPEFGKSLPMQIAEYIARKIFQGDLQIGERLKEEELSELFQTSRALQIEGLVERLPRRGTIVKAYTDKELRELYEVRLGLEKMAMEAVQQSWCAESRRKFDEVLQNMELALNQEDAEEYARLNDLFHQLLFQLADNSILWRMYRQLKNVLIAMLQLSTQEIAQMRVSYREHAEIVRALASEVACGECPPRYGPCPHVSKIIPPFLHTI
jgi:DNA-binding GntR family transcriptional regulator